MANRQVVRSADLSELAANPAMQAAIMSRGSLQGMITRTAEELAAFNDDFLGPGQPLVSFRGHQPPRQYDYPASVNIRTTPERPFTVLRNLASWDPVRYCIEKRKNGIKRQKWAIGPVDPDDDQALEKYADDIVSLTKYWAMPDPQNKMTLDLWLSEFMELSFLFDAAVVMRWPARKWSQKFPGDSPKGSDIACHRIINGESIVPKIDSLGNIPLPPAPAYQQVIKGLPLTEYTSDQMIYCVRNPRPDSPYGMSEVEWLLMVINIALRRDTSDLLHWTAGNVPYGFGEVPSDWTPAQIEEWGKIWDDMLAGDLAARSKVKWGPSGMNFKTFQDRDKVGEEYKFYEWSSRRACAIFGVACSPYTSQLTRAGAETSEELAAETAEEPLTQFIEQLITTEIQQAQGYPELCFRYVTEKKTDEAAVAESNKTKIFSGQTSIDDILIESGQDPIGCPPFIVLPGLTEPYYLRGMNPEYIAKYKPFFDKRDEEAAAKPVPPVPGAPSALPPKPGEPTPKEEKPPIEAPKPNEEPPKNAAALEDLRKWRKVAIRCEKEGKAQRKFESTAIPDEIKAVVETGLEYGNINDTFAAAERQLEMIYQKG